MEMKFLLAVFKKIGWTYKIHKNLYIFSTFVQTLIIAILASEIFEAYPRKVLFSEILSEFINYLVKWKGNLLSNGPRKIDQFWSLSAHLPRICPDPPKRYYFLLKFRISLIVSLVEAKVSKKKFPRQAIFLKFTVFYSVILP